MVNIYANTLDVVGRRLYTGKSTWLREYIQNSIDAGAEDIEVVIRDRELCINDNGKGMNAVEVENKAFSIGNPEINPNKIGELGIGIYAGLGISNRIRILTKKKGMTEAIEAIFDVRKYYGIIEDLAKKDYSLDDAINEVFSINKVQNQGDSLVHYTKITFEDLLEDRVNIPTANDIREFVSNNINVPIGSSFPWKREVDAYVQGLAKEVKVSIIDGTGNEEYVSRYENLSTDLYQPYKYTIYIPKSSGNEFARTWFCYSKNGKSFDESKVIVRYKGMVIGDEDTLRFRMGSRIENRLLGEIVINENCGLEVNSERNWFVSSGALTKFTKELKEVLQRVYSDLPSTDSLYGVVIKNRVSKINELVAKRDEHKKDGNTGIVKDLDAQIETKKIEIERKREKRDKVIEKLEDEVKRNPQDGLSLIRLNMLKERKDEDDKNAVIGISQNVKTKQGTSNFPKAVQTFLKENIIDEELREKIEMEGVRQVSSSAFIFIELLLKKMAGWKENREVTDFALLLNDFKQKNSPKDLDGADIGNFMQNFDRFVNSAHYFFRHPSAHSFMEKMNNPRHIFQAMLIADFTVYLIRQFVPRNS